MASLYDPVGHAYDPRSGQRGELSDDEKIVQKAMKLWDYGLFSV